MSELEIIGMSAQSDRQDARDLQSRLYREIGLAAVEAELKAIGETVSDVRALFAARDDRATIVAFRSRGRAA